MVRPDSTISLVPLSVQQDGDEYVIGNIDTGLFLRVPPEAIAVTELIDGSRTVAEVRALLMENGLDIDVLDFITSLHELGLVAQVDDHVVAPEVARPVSRWVSLFGSLLFCTAAKLFYALAGLLSVALLIIHPRLRPTFQDSFVLTSSVGLSLLILFVSSWCLTCLHELGHMFAAAATGVAVRFRLNLRFLWLVAETDMTGLWQVPRDKWQTPFLAGMAWDSIVLVVSLIAQLTIQDGALVRLGRMVCLILVYRFVWQLLVFLRTDLYYVISAWTQAVDLVSSSKLALLNYFGVANHEATVLWNGLPSREKNTARMFVWVYLLGIAFCAVIFTFYQAPAAYLALTTAVRDVIEHTASSAKFWDGAISLCIMTAEALLWSIGGLTAVRERRLQRNVGASG